MFFSFVFLFLLRKILVNTMFIIIIIEKNVFIYLSIYLSVDSSIC